MKKSKQQKTKKKTFLLFGAASTAFHTRLEAFLLP